MLHPMVCRMVVYEGVCHVFARAPAPLNGCSGAENMYRVLCVVYWLLLNVKSWRFLIVENSG